MRIVLATDAWEPQVNGVVRTLTRTVAECRDMGHEVEVIEPSLFKTIPCPTYPEIRLALGAEEEIREMLRAFEPEAVHIATEGPIGIATRRICVEWKLPFTTSYHTKFPEYVSARFPIPVQVGYAYMKWFHKPSGRLMVATPTLRDELVEHGFKNVSPWSRGVDTEVFRPDLEPIYDQMGAKDWPRPFFLNVGRVAVEKNIEAFLELDLPGTKIIVGDGPARAELQEKYPEAKFLGARFGGAGSTSLGSFHPSSGLGGGGASRRRELPTTSSTRSCPLRRTGGQSAASQQPIAATRSPNRPRRLRPTRVAR